MCVSDECLTVFRRLAAVAAVSLLLLCCVASSLCHAVVPLKTVLVSFSSVMHMSSL